MRVIKIGRSPVNDVVISDSTVSSQHAVITVLDSGIVNIKDLNSKNGTFVNGVCVYDVIQLSGSDLVKLGHASLDWRKIIHQSEKIVAFPKSGQAAIPSDVKERRSIGRSLNSQIRFNFEDVSSDHAFLCQLANGDVVIIDNSSTNGTYVNGNRVSFQLLKKGDIVLISKKYTLQWESVFSFPVFIDRKKRRVWPWIACILILMLIATGTGVWYYYTQRPLAPEKIYAKYQKTVVMIYQKFAYVATVYDKPLGEYIGDNAWNYFYVDAEDNVRQGIAGATGTGFFISSDGKIMTNKHVVALMDGDSGKADKVKETIQLAIIKNYPGNQSALLLARSIVIKYNVFYLGIALNDTHVSSENDLIPCSVYKISNDDKIDIAILQVNSKKTPSEVVNLVDLNDITSNEDLVLGKKVYTIGFPQSFTLGETEIGLEANNQSGEITQQRGEYQYGHNITIHQGASGSPVFNDRGKFAGVIVSGYLGLSQGYNQAIQPKPAAELTK